MRFVLTLCCSIFELVYCLQNGTIINAVSMSVLKSYTHVERNDLSHELSTMSVIVGADSTARPVQEQSAKSADSSVHSNVGSNKVSEQSGPSDDEIIALVLEEGRKADYKMIVVPIDIWDFGGQKIYFLTHQLFISSRGTYVVIFNGSKNIEEEMPDIAFLPGFKRITTTADFLLHWVNSILTFCEKTSTGTGKKYPRILFVATHKDKTTNIDQQRRTIKENLTTLFENHAGKDHLMIDQLFFLNTKDTNDEDLSQLREALIDVACEHPSWGELMPKKFVPLELQMAKQASQGKKILSITEVRNLNDKNETMSLQPKELEAFLKIQHALGKIIYFDEDNLREYVVTHPAYPIDVLRSIVTEKIFWPNDEAIRKTFEDLSKTGIIRKSAIILLWKQPGFNHLFPFSKFLINILVRLDIMLEAKTETESSYFIVPSMITDRPFEDTFKREKCIFLAYKFAEEIIPTALLYRFFVSFIVLRNLNADISNLRLFTDSAVVSIDNNHQVQAYVVGNRIIVALMHKEGKSDIKPSIASTVQECLTRGIIGTLDFYYAIANTSQMKKLQFPFTIEIGIPYKDDLCFIEQNQIPSEKNLRWMCQVHKTQHSETHVSLWFYDKEPIRDEICAEGCQGLELSWLLRDPAAKHLRRLGSILNKEQSRSLFIALGLQKTKWDNLETQYDKRDAEDLHFNAFWYWREHTNNPTFGRLLETLQKNEISACLLCKVVHDIKLEEDFSDEMKAWIPNDTSLEDLSHNIGSATFQLGIELGLTVTELQNIERKHKDLIEQTRAVLQKWKESLNLVDNECPIIILVKSLQRVGKSRIICDLKYHFETEKSRVKKGGLKCCNIL